MWDKVVQRFNSGHFFFVGRPQLTVNLIGGDFKDIIWVLFFFLLIF